MNDLVFKDYRKEKPTKEGVFVWRLNHKFIKDVVIVFTAKYRSRGAGYETVLSPEFDYWDGYRVLLPDGPIEWCEYDGEPRKYTHEIIDIEGLKNVACPFCGKIPKWVYSGRYICADPTDTDYFYLQCCAYFDGFGTRDRNPKDITKARNEALENKEVVR
jgi:hypothetical protein